MQPHGKNNDFGHPDTPRLPGTEPSTKGYTWFQPKMWQRNALLGISGRSGLWSGKGSIEAPTKGLFPFVGASIELLPDQRPLLPLMPQKTFLCHTFGWNHVYPLVDDSVPVNLGVSGIPKTLFFPWGYIPLHLL